MRKHIVPDAGVASRACKLQFPDAQVGLVPIVAIMLVAGALVCSEHPMGHMALSSSKLRFRAGLVSSLFDFLVDTNSCKHKVPHALLNNKLLVTNALLNNKLFLFESTCGGGDAAGLPVTGECGTHDFAN